MPAERAIGRRRRNGRAEDAAPPAFTPFQIRSVISGLMLAMFLASLDQTIVATALSSIARDLRGWQIMAWVVSSYLITSTVTTPIYGRLSDLYGRRPIMLISIVIFVGASILSAASVTMAQLVGARALQGLGGGGLRSISQAVIADIIAPRDRGRYQGYFSGVFVISNALGPVLGGVMSQYLSWHWIFWINVPLGAAAFLLCNRQLARLRPPAEHAPVDWLGAVLILAATTLVLLGFDAAQRNGEWLTLQTVGLAGAGGALALLLIRHEAGAAAPMLPLGLFRSREFSLSCLVLFISTGIATAVIVLVPIDYQLVAGLSPNHAGFQLIPLTVGTVIGSFGAGQLVTRTGRYRIFPVAGNLVVTLVCLALTYVGLGRSGIFDVLSTAVLGVALGCNYSPLTVAAQNSLESDDNGIGMACVLFFRLIGGAFAVALLSTILIAHFAQGVTAMAGHEALALDPGQALLDLEIGSAALPASVVAALVGSMRAAFSDVFLASAIIMPIALVASLFLKEAPLRKRNAAIVHH